MTVRSEHSPGVALGLLVGVLLTAALVAVFFIGARLLSLPLVPFDVFDWMARVLPGSVVTFGIDLMVGIVRGLDLGATSEVAKSAEQVLAVGLFFAGGVVTAAIFFAVMKRLDSPRARAVGLGLGVVLGIAVALISASVNRTAAAGPLLGGAWIVALVATWGGVLGWTWRRLAEAARADVDASVERVGRREFLIRLGGATAAITVVGSGVAALAGSGRRAVAPRSERWSATNRLPNAGAGVEPVRGTRPEFTSLENHYRIDINTRPPVIDAAEWRLRVSGLFENPTELTLDQLRAYEPMDQFVTLECISNPVAGDLISTQRWTGVSLQRLLEDLRPSSEATHLRLDAADGFYEYVALETIRQDPRVMLAYAWDGVPLAPGHGFPLRIYIPNVFGMKQPKWITSVEAVNGWQPGYWVERGWDREATMKITSVIDTVASDMMLGQGPARIPVGGIAFAGDRGVSRVQVRVDDGPWEEAQLRAPLAETTWVLWRYEWPFEEGDHTFTVRCFDGDGTQQVAEDTPIRPDGATGYHSLSRML
jgi:DMSO/TMAO reductase YedYZ molybdopterin-dependent catalytic subunit